MPPEVTSGVAQGVSVVFRPKIHFIKFGPLFKDQTPTTHLENLHSWNTPKLQSKPKCIDH